MAVVQFGNLEPFDADEESIAAYLECVELYFTVSETPEEKRVAVFLSSIGGKNYSLLCDLLAPAKLGEKTVEQLSQALKDHFQLKKVVIAERFKFH